MNLANALVIMGTIGFGGSIFVGAMAAIERDYKEPLKAALILGIAAVILIITGACLMDYHMAHQIVRRSNEKRM